jgi:hypothetical protein
MAYRQEEVILLSRPQISTLFLPMRSLREMVEHDIALFRDDFMTENLRRGAIPPLGILASMS